MQFFLQHLVGCLADGGGIEAVQLQQIPGRAGAAELVLHQLADIGVTVSEGDVVATVEGQPMRCTISGVLRGILPEGTPVFRGMKAGDVDPRGKREYCDTVSDKALAVGGGVLEAVLALSGKLKEEP